VSAFDLPIEAESKNVSFFQKLSIFLYFVKFCQRKQPIRKISSQQEMSKSALMASTLKGLRH
jgi:hypothetical protein